MPLQLQRRHGDLLDAPEQYLIHQCNCISEGARGLAQALFWRCDRPGASVHHAAAVVVEQETRARPADSPAACCPSQNLPLLATRNAQRYPHANVYARRTRFSGIKDKPGTITVCGDGHAQRFAFNLFGQYYPGAAKSRGMDTAAKRLEYFKQVRAVIPACGGAGALWRYRLSAGSTSLSHQLLHTSTSKSIIVTPPPHPPKGLKQLAELEGALSFAFPHLIGCGLAGGDWARYEAALEAFADEVGVPVVLYQIGAGAEGGGGGSGGAAAAAAAAAAGRKREADYDEAAGGGLGKRPKAS